MTSSIPDKAKLNAIRYVDTLCAHFFEEFKSILLSGFICQQDGVPTKRLLTQQSWLRTRLTPAAVNLLAKNEWLPNSPDGSPLDYHV